MTGDDDPVGGDLLARTDAEDVTDAEFGDGHLNFDALAGTGHVT